MYRTDKLAILLATYNGEKYISEQIDSILAQSEKDWMLYIHDDGSKDQTREIIMQYEKKYPKQICVVDAPVAGGAKENFFLLFQQVEAPYYMCCDQDDVWLSDKIEKTKKELLHLEQGETTLPCLVFTDLKVVDAKLAVISDSMSLYQGLDYKNLSLNRALIQNVVTGCTMMVNRALREELIKVTEYENVLMHDWWAMLVAARFGRLKALEEPTILYRQHGYNGVGAQNSSSIFYMIKRMFQGDDIKISLANTRKQALYFAEVYKEEATSLISEYAALGKKNKLARLAFYKKNDVRKSTLSKNIGLIMWG